MKKKGKAKQRAPAKPTAKHPEVLAIEQPLRDWIYVQKRFKEDGPDAAVAAMSGLIDDRTDPSSASMVAIASAQMLDSGMFDHDSAQDGRSRGGNQRAIDRQNAAEGDYVDIRRTATRLVEDGKSPKDVVGIIKELTTHSRTKIYRALRTHPAGHWNKKT